MPLPLLAGQLIVPGRNTERDRYRRNYSIRNPGAPTNEGTQVWVDASVMADATAPIYANCITIANGCSRQTRTGALLDDDAQALGTERQPAIGASGSVEVTTSVTGAHIEEGDEIVIAGYRFECAETGDYADGDDVPITGIDVGPGTNQPAGTIGTWSAPRPGLASNATVVAQQNGQGLTGGADVESDSQLRDRLDAIAANPPASGNDAQYQALLGMTPNVAVGQAFTYPDINGPGSIAITFTLRPSQPGATRIPNNTQLALAYSWLTYQFPAADGIYMMYVAGSPVNVNLKVTWSQASSGWVDQQPWPPYVSGTQVQIDGTQPITPTSFSLTGFGTVLAPAVGQSLAFFDLPNLTWRLKKILTVAISGSDYVITVDTSDGASDTSYTPYSGQIVCPWSDSLQDLVLPLVSYFDTLGPGELFSSAQFLDPGLRMKRSPPNPQVWPSTLSNRVTTNLFSIPSVQDVIVQDPAIPYACPVGSPGVWAWLLTLQNIAVFPE